MKKNNNLKLVPANLSADSTRYPKERKLILSLRIIIIIMITFSYYPCQEVFTLIYAAVSRKKAAKHKDARRTAPNVPAGTLGAVRRA